MASTSSSHLDVMVIETRKKFNVKPKTMMFGLEELRAVIEHIVNFEALRMNGYSLQDFFKFHGWMKYFDMLNGPTFPYLIKDLWVRAKVYDKDVAVIEEIQKFAKNEKIKGKSRAEMGLSKFKEVEIRYVVIRVKVTITLNHIYKLMGLENVVKCVINMKGSSLESNLIKDTYKLTTYLIFNLVMSFLI